MIGLVSAFYTPTQGRILVDGVDLSTVKLSSYRTQLGVVLQETFLFDGSIRENVSYARPGATEAEIMEACRIARVDEFAENYEKKYDTVVGERGVKLSGGQKQRVSIARAILADPRILILDEATSSLDSESEALIQEGLRYLMRGRTTFVIAHRLSTIRRAEQILVVQEGNILERGTHESLYTAHGRYYDLYTKQHSVETNLFLAPGEGDKLEEAERIEQLFPLDPEQGFSGRDLHDPRQHVGGMAVLPERARLVVQRQFCDPLGELGEIEIAAVEIRGRIGLADQAIAIEAISDAGGVAHQVENGRRPPWRHQFKCLGAVRGYFFHTDFDVGEGWNVFRDGLVELDLAILDQCHRDNRGDRLGHREQSKDGLVGDRRFAHHILHAEGFVIDRLAMLLDQKDRAGDLAGRDLVPKERADLRKLVGLKCAPAGMSNVPSARDDGAATSNSAPQASARSISFQFI